MKRLTLSKRLLACLLALSLMTAIYPASATAAPTPNSVYFNQADYQVSNGSLAAVVFGVTNSTITKDDITLLSSNTGVATVVSYAIDVAPSSAVTMVAVLIKNNNKAGKATINVSSPSAKFTAAAFTVTANEKVAKLQVMHKQVNVKGNKLYLKRGKSAALAPYIIGKNNNESEGQIVSLASKKVSWKSSNKKVATVSKSGKVTVKKNAKVGAKAVITAKYAKKTYKTTIAVALLGGTIKSMQALSTINEPLIPGFTYQIGYSARLTGTPSNKVTYKSSKPSVASVNAHGILTPKKAGSTTVRVKIGGKSISYKIKVLNGDDLLKSSLSTAIASLQA